MSENRTIDSELLDALMVPARQADYPRDSRAFVRIDTSLRVYWHVLFDICPELLELSGPDGLSIFRPFMAWADARQLSMNWTFYIWVYQWLLESEFRDQVTNELARSLMAASAARWATGDRSTNSGIVLGCADFPELIAGWKCHSASGGREVERLELEDSLPMPQGRLGYFTVAKFELDNFPGWSEIPR